MPSSKPREPPDRIGLIMRSADDLVLVRPHSWWTPRRLLMALAAVGAVLAGAIAWAEVLERHPDVLFTIEHTPLIQYTVKALKSREQFKAQLPLLVKLPGGQHGFFGGPLRDAIKRIGPEVLGGLTDYGRTTPPACNEFRPCAIRLLPSSIRPLTSARKPCASALPPSSESCLRS
jgi:hypothetical protein